MIFSVFVKSILLPRCSRFFTRCENILAMREAVLSAKSVSKVHSGVSSESVDGSQAGVGRHFIFRNDDDLSSGLDYFLPEVVE